MYARSSDLHLCMEFIFLTRTAQMHYLVRVSELAETVQSGPDRIEGISTSQCLGDDIAGTDQFHHRAHRSTRDDSRSLGRGFEQHMFRSE